MATKLFIPPIQPTSVSRPRLLEQLNEGMRCKLMLISASAGFGKTALISDWIHQNKSPVAWFSIDKGDNDPVHFLTYIITVLQNIEANIGKTALKLLRSPQLPPIQSILIDLINDIIPFPKDFALVLDDYHLIDKRNIHFMIAFLLEHLPQRMHLVIATRSDPPLPLARLRSQNQLMEIRATDLCFTTDETSMFFNERLNLGLSIEDIALLKSRAEGWIAGLQLAALSMQGRKDTSSFIKSFKGDNRYIADYLIEEVLSRQPEIVQNFLLQTSILSRLSGPLCNDVTHQSDSQEMLNTLEKANLFIFPLDNERHWFRYHRLFADLLLQRLHQTQGDLMPELHRRACEWNIRNGLRYEAVDHALSAQDFDLSAHLIEKIAEIDWDRGRESKLLGWFKVLPDEQISSNPQLCVFHARELFEDGDPESAEMRLQEAERMLEITGDRVNEALPGDSAQQYRPGRVELQGKIAVIRAMMASYKGDIPKIIQYSRQALQSLQKEDLMWRSVAATILGFAHGWSGDGDLVKAQKAFSEAKTISKAAGNIYMNLLASHCLYAVETLQGRLKEAKEKLQNLIQLTEESGLSRIGIAGNNYSTLGSILYEMNDLEEGMRYIERGIQLAELGHDTIALMGCYFNLIKALFHREDFSGAQSIIQKIEKAARNFALPPWMMHTLEALKAWIWLESGNMDAASRWIKERGLTINDELSQRREAEHMVLARILMAQDQLDEAERLLIRLIKKAKEGSRIMMEIELRKLKALILYAQGNTVAALDELRQALSLAEPGGLVRTFVSEGSPIAELLERILDESKKVQDDKKASFSQAYLKKLLLAFKADTLPRTTGSLVEPLSEREFEVLHLISTGLTNQEIAKRLFISLNTVRTHTKNINSKLNVHSRTQAVARAKERGLL